MSNPNGQDSTAMSMLSSPSIHGGRMNQEPFSAVQPQRASQYSQMTYGQSQNMGSQPGYLAT